MSSTTPKKLLNRVKAEAQKWRGPARTDQDAVPIADAIRAYWDRDSLSLSIPAHRGGAGARPEPADWIGAKAFRADAPMSHGVDRRDRAWEVQSTAQALAADALGAEQVFFSTNGSSLSAHVAILGAVGLGDTLVLARNSHKSVFAGLVLSGARPVYVEPDYDDRLELAHDVVPDELERVLEQHHEAKAEMITPYPPGIPVLAPGERITAEILSYLERIVAAGAFIEGAADQSLDQLRVVA